MFRKLASSLVMSCVAVSTAFAQVVHPEGQCIFPKGDNVWPDGGYQLDYVYGHDKSDSSQFHLYAYWAGGYDLDVVAKNINGVVWRGLDELIIRYTDESGLEDVTVPLANAAGPGIRHDPSVILSEPNPAFVIHDGHPPNSGPMLWCDGAISKFPCQNDIFANDGKTDPIRGFMEFRRQEASGWNKYFNGKITLRSLFWVYAKVKDIPNFQHMESVHIRATATCFQGCTSGNEHRDGLNECTGFIPVE